MSTLVLARKYRPRNFESMVGQQHVVQALSNALTQQRLHHAYLFTGTRGVGKTTVSRILAKSLNCTGPDGQGGITATPCGVCDACREIDAGRFVDYIELDAASNRGVDEISQLLDQAVYKPVVGRFKVYMIDEVHMLSNTAFNAMLKTLEEPPDYLKFVLATTDPQKVPPTVLSRCLQFNLRPMAPQTVQEHLVEVLKAEALDTELAAIRLLSRAAKGSMRDALSLTDQAIAFGAGSLTEAGVRQMLGAVDRGHAVRILDALSASDGAALVQVADDLRGLGLSAAGTLEELAELLQTMAVHQVAPGSLDESDPDSSSVANLAGKFAADEIQLNYSICLHGRAELSLAPDEYSALVMVLLRMLAFRPAGAQAIGDRERNPNHSPAKTPAAAVKPSAPAPVSTAAPQERSAPMLRAAQSRGATSSATSLSIPTSLPATAATANSADEPPPWLDAIDTLAPQDDAVPSPETDRSQEEPRFAGDDAISVAPAAAQASVSLQSTPLGDRWNEAVSKMLDASSITALTRELALQAQCVEINDQQQPALWRLRVERETLRTAAQIDKLRLALSQALDRAVRVEIEAGVALDSPALRCAAEKARRQRHAEALIHNDPLVLSLRSQFSTAFIVPGSIQPLG